MENEESALIFVLFALKVHKIEFEHGTTTGRRLIKVDGKVRGIIN